MHCNCCPKGFSKNWSEKNAKSDCVLAFFFFHFCKFCHPKFESIAVVACSNWLFLLFIIAITPVVVNQCHLSIFALLTIPEINIEPLQHACCTLVMWAKALFETKAFEIDCHQLFSFVLFVLLWECLQLSCKSMLKDGNLIDRIKIFSISCHFCYGKMSFSFALIIIVCSFQKQILHWCFPSGRWQLLALWFACKNELLFSFQWSKQNLFSWIQVWINCATWVWLGSLCQNGFLKFWAQCDCKFSTQFSLKINFCFFHSLLCAESNCLLHFLFISIFTIIFNSQKFVKVCTNM